MSTSKAKYSPGFTPADPGSGSGVTSLRKGFTLVELIIVVSILGILAAIVLPEFQGHAQLAKEATAKDNLRILREAIERYAAEHNGVPPGYVNDNAASTPTGLVCKLQLEGNYINKVPTNPINGLNTIFAIDNTTAFPATANDSTGWLYKPSTKEIRINSIGPESGATYFSY